MMKFLRSARVQSIALWLSVAFVGAVSIGFGINGNDKREFQTVCSFHCMDCRLQKPALKFVEDYMHKKLRTSVRVDVGTCPAPNQALAENKKKHLVQTLMDVLEVSTNHHGAKALVIFGHADCAGNTDNHGRPVGRNEHVQNLLKAREHVRRSHHGAKLETIVLVWADQAEDQTWTFEVIE